MATVEALIVSLQKAGEKSPWRMTMLVQGKMLTATNVGAGGQTPVGPRLSSVLAYLETGIKGYPFQYGLNMVADPTRRLVAVRYLNDDNMAMIEMTERTANHVLSSKIQPMTYRVDESLDFSGDMTASDFEETPMVMSLMASSMEESVTTPAAFLVYGRVIEVYDGDTIDLKLTMVHKDLAGKKIGNYEMSKGNTVRIRLLGLDSPETRKNDGGYAAAENAALASKWNVPVETVFSVAEEAKAKLKEIVGPGSGGEEVLVALQYEKSTMKGVADSSAGRRPLGVLYRVKGANNEAEVLKSLEEGEMEATNINKSLLALRYSKDTSLPLYEPDTYMAARSSEMGINVSGWEAEIGYTGEQKSILEQKLGDVTQGPTSENNAPDDTYFRQTYTDPQSNALEFVKPYDDRLEDENGIYSRMIKMSPAEDALEKPFNYVHKVRIGDVMLTVPPLSIRMGRISNIEKIKTLRTQSAMMKGLGSAETVLTMELYFSGMSDINGYKKEGYKVNGKTVNYFMDGLRPLIAQFKKAPFLPIDNDYINNALNIQNVALVNLSVETVEDFPESLRATLTLAKFEPTAYMIQEPSLGSLMNYPLFRWYYQDAMQPPAENRPKDKIHLEYISKLTNEFSFSVADEDRLRYRQEAIQEVNKMMSPDEFEEQKENKNTELGARYEDMKRARKVMGQFERYQQLPEQELAKNLIGKRVVSQKGTQTPSGSSFDYGFPMEAHKELYGTSEPRWESGTQNSSFVPKEYQYFDRYIEKLEETSAFKSLWAKQKDEALGLFIIAFGDSGNRSRFSSGAQIYKDGKPFARKDGTLYLAIPATPGNIKKMETIEASGSIIEAEIKNYATRYEELVAIVNSTEEDVAMVSYEIPNLIPKNMSVMYENHFSKQQMQVVDSPTLQYLGGQDPYVQVIFEGDEETVKAVNDMLLLVEKYNREYRQGIVAGFMDIDNPLVRLFGIKTVMPENVQIDTVPGYPGRFQIVMALAGFNRTQRRLEKLTGISGAFEDTTMDDRYVTAYSKEKDMAVIEYRMRNMEVYPDLELPTFEELNDALPYLGAGFERYENRQNQYFVDPDFYISTQTTMRNMVESLLEEESDITVISYDNTGKDDTSKLHGNGFIENSGALVSSFKTLDAMTEPVPSDFTWEDEDETKGNESKPKSASEVKPNLKGDVASYIEESGDSSAYKKFPSYERWKTFSGNAKKSLAAYEAEKAKKDNPREEEVWMYLMRQIVSSFGSSKLFFREYEKKTFQGKVLSEKEAKNFKSKYLRKEVYGELNAMAFDVYAGSLNLYYEDLAGDYKDWSWKKMSKSDREKYNKASNAENKANEDVIDWMYGWNDWNREKGIVGDDKKNAGVKIPIHRLAALMKAVMAIHSNWSAFDASGAPVLSGGWRAGIMGYPLDMAETKEEAERLLYDWRYNIKQSVNLMKKHYNQAWSSKDLRFKSLAEQWMVWAYGVSGQSGDVLPFDKKSDEETKVLPMSLEPGAGYATLTMREAKKRYMGYDGIELPTGMFAGGKSTVIPYVMAMYMGLPKSVSDAFQGKKKQMVDMMVDELFYPLSLYKFRDGKEVIENKYGADKMKAERTKAKNKLLSYKAEQVEVKMYSHLSELSKKIEGLDANSLKDWAYRIGSSALSGVVAGIFGGVGAGAGAAAGQFFKQMISDWLSTPISKRTEVGEEMLNAYDKMVENGDINAQNRLIMDKSPKEIHFDMYKDMLEYDMQGRLVRAFPTFQMFIVDEGKWFSNYKLWDNLYGFNAIQSIDVNRSRKIAADTASITMTNMYSNLNGRRTDVMNDKVKVPAFWSNIVWSQYILGRPSEEYMEARKELYQSMWLQTGARIHLRMGYGANVLKLPVVFNGTITEMDTSEVVTILCQGDGIELANMISGDPNDDNKKFLRVQEPMETISRLLTSKGNWLQNLINDATDGQFFKDNPLGIAHFGAPVEAPSGNFVPFNREFGEAAQNIYSSNGVGTFDQWKNEKGERVDIMSVLRDFDTYGATGITNWLQPGDEDNIIVKYYNNTVWDIVQTFAACSSDYIAAVMPFEMRSTLFFGKPHWPAAYRYDSTYTYDAAVKEWVRQYEVEHRKPYMQMHVYDSYHNIISNNIKASEEGVYTNVIVSYDGHVTPILQADNDIRLDKQKTIVLEADIVGRFPGMEFWTSEDQASKFGHSMVRDYMKDMYKGHLLVLGDPTLKPHDMAYMSDTMVQMNGPMLVKSVTHHFNMETGFVSSIEPDAVVTNWDMDMVYHAKMASAIGRTVGSISAGYGSMFIGKRMVTKSKIYKWMVESDNFAKRGAKKLAERTTIANLVKATSSGSFASEEMQAAVRGLEKAETLDDVKRYADKIDDVLKTKQQALAKAGDAVDAKELKRMETEIKEMKQLMSSLKNIKNINKGANIVKKSVTIMKGMMMTNIASALIGAAFTVATESLFEMWRRKKQNTQCVTIFPLQYRGGEFVAGINGHQGAVYGDEKSKADRFYNAHFGDGDEDRAWYEYVSATMNLLSND